MSAEALRPSWEARRRRSLELVRVAIESLQRRGSEITVQTIYAETRRLDPGNTGVHPTTYQRNAEVAELISRTTGRPSAVEWHLDFRGVSTANLRAGRDLHRAFHRLKAKTKRDLAVRVLVLEEEVIALREQLAQRDVEELRRLEQALEAGASLD